MTDPNVNSDTTNADPIDEILGDSPDNDAEVLTNDGSAPADEATFSETGDPTGDNPGSAYNDNTDGQDVNVNDPTVIETTGASEPQENVASVEFGQQDTDTSPDYSNVTPEGHIDDSDVIDQIAEQQAKLAEDGRVMPEAPEPPPYTYSADIALIGTVTFADWESCMNYLCNLDEAPTSVTITAVR